MKKTLTSLLIGLACASASTFSHADDLLSVYQLAKSSDPVVLRAAALFKASEEDIDQARAVLLPQINAFGSYTESETNFDNAPSLDSETEVTTFGASLDMQIYHHSTWLRLDNAKKSAHRSDVNYQVTKQDLIVRVANSYFDVLGAKDDLEFATAEKVAIERQLEQTKQRYSVGLTAITDVHEAQAQYDNAVTEEIRAQNGVYTTEEALRVITNVYPRDLEILNTERFSTSTPVPNNINQWQQTAETKSLDIIFQKIGVDIAKENINIAKSGHYPTLSLNGNYSDTENDDVLAHTTSEFDNQSIGITLNVPIYAGGAISSSVRQAQSNYVAASQDLDGAHRDTVRKTRNAFNTVNTAISGIKALEQSVISTESALKATEAGFEVGTRTIVDVLDSTRNLYNAKRNLSSTRYAYILSVLALKRAAGTISEQDLANINQGLSAPTQP